MRHSTRGRKLLRSFRRSGIVFIGIGAVSFFTVTMTSQNWSAGAFGLAFVLAGVALLAGVPLLMRRGVLKNYAMKPDKDLVVTYELSEDRLVCKSEVASTDLLWRAIQKVLRTPDGFLVYLTDVQIHWLPMRGFQNEADQERFAQLAKAEGEDYRDER
jgi:dipeptide/tripeptide permease